MGIYRNTIEKTLKKRTKLYPSKRPFTLVAIQQYIEIGVKSGPFTFNHYAPLWQFVLQQETKSEYDH